MATAFYSWGHWSRMLVCLQVHLILQLCSQGGSPHEQIPFCLDEVTNIEKDFVLEIFDTISPNCHAALHGAHELAPVDVAMHVNSLCTGNNGPEPCIKPLVLAGMSHDVPKVLGFFVQFQPLYLWELGQMVQVCLVHQALSAMKPVAADCSHHIHNTVTFATIGICIICQAT